MRTALVVSLITLSLGFATGIFAADPASQPKFQNTEAPGNLESKHDIGCVGADKVVAQYTPTDLYKAMSKCINAGLYKEAAFLFAIAGVYGRFDTLRVTDKTAHQAVSVARIQVLQDLDKDKQTAFQENVKATLGNTEGLAAACKEVMRIGAPDYYPRYMIQHGMDAILTNDKGEEVRKDFDAKAAWTTSLATYLHCPGV